MYLCIFLAFAMVLVCPVYNKPRSIYYPHIVCGHTDYERSEQICCDEQLYDKKTGAEECCGYKVFDSNLMKCCNKMNGKWVIRKSDSCTPTLPKTSSYTEQLEKTNTTSHE
ncbi:hypothetical protein NP493_1078g01034 [Ridgeia piscesae]|uniref:Galaxin-like repeats domain-containing protein n=1 Tax=Ridgeia piscesae TaxID=27915 RepID=A0AAD9KHJ8_RIDPI|nr:hypothetical protein NP493_1078g01034 [Ridgeia piscesae]